MTITYYYKNKGGYFSKLVDEDEAYEDVTEIITGLKDKHKTTVLATITRKGENNE